MSTLSSTTPISLDEFEQLPDVDGIQELLDGCIIEMPPPKRRHTEIARNIAQLLIRLTGESRVWTEGGLVIGKNCLQPDVAVSFPDQREQRDWFSGVPMLAVEVASRGNTPDQLELKKNIYLSNGALEVWMVYEKTRSVTVHSPDGSAISHTKPFRTAALEGEIALSDVFRGRA